MPNDFRYSANSPSNKMSATLIKTLLYVVVVCSTRPCPFRLEAVFLVTAALDDGAAGPVSVSAVVLGVDS
jgi:hypothetical protein